ncbi:hypothetical protein, partial [Tahibacter caeni]|uniref:hypothetical protein n=1 Tax=Tahibacter caeni TaxID=1453545 RepID=UPI002148D083
MISSYDPLSQRVRRRPPFAVAVACLSFAALAQAEPAVLTLDALREAVRNAAPRLDAAAARVDAARADAARAD